jgi:hypothetical protein
LLGGYGLRARIAVVGSSPHRLVKKPPNKDSIHKSELRKRHQPESPAISGNGVAMRTHLFHRRKAASLYLKENWGVNCAHGTLAKYAVTGGGPVFRRMGRVPLYSTDDLDKWVESRLSGPMRSTSDTACEMPDSYQQADPRATVKQGDFDGAEKSTARRRRTIT